MSVQTIEVKETMDTPTKEGLPVQLEISILMHLTPASAAPVYRTAGVAYVQNIIEPNLRSIVRGVTTMHEARSLYTSERDLLAKAINDDLLPRLEARGIALEQVLLRKIELPQGLSQSITAKMQADQEAQRMEFVLQKEKQEAERKKIEATGIAEFQKIVTQGISEQLLEWKGIEATERLSMSQNTKIVIIGANKSGLPIILGQ